MMTYYLTVYDKDSTVLLNESFEYEEDAEAISHGRKRLEEENYFQTTHRLTRKGKLLLFYR